MDEVVAITVTVEQQAWLAEHVEHFPFVGATPNASISSQILRAIHDALPVEAS